MKASGDALARHDAIKDQNKRQYDTARAQCQAVARQNQALIKQQADNQHRAQQQAAVASQQAQQAERAQAAARSDALRVQQQAQLELANRQQAARVNESRVIGQVPASNYDPGTQRAVQTPQQQAQARIEAEQNARAQKAREAQAYRDVAVGLVTGSIARVGQEYSDRQLNPGGTRDATVDSTVELARQQNADINKARRINPIATATADSSLTSTGAVFNNALGQSAAIEQTASLNTTPPARTGGGGVSTGGQPSASPADAETAYWDSIKGSANVHDFRTYLSRYPSGRFRVLAEGRITALTTGSVTQTTPQQQATPTTDTRSRWYRD